MFDNNYKPIIFSLSLSNFLNFHILVSEFSIWIYCMFNQHFVYDFTLWIFSDMIYSVMIQKFILENFENALMYLPRN